MDWMAPLSEGSWQPKADGGLRCGLQCLKVISPVFGSMESTMASESTS